MVGEMVLLEPVTTPMPWSRLSVTPEPVTAQFKLLELPVVMLVGVAVKLEMTGATGATEPTVTVTGNETLPAELLALKM